MPGEMKNRRRSCWFSPLQRQWQFESFASQPLMNGGWWWFGLSSACVPLFSQMTIRISHLCEHCHVGLLCSRAESSRQNKDEHSYRDEWQDKLRDKLVEDSQSEYRFSTQTAVEPCDGMVGRG